MASVPIKGRVPPHNDEAEQATLGALLLDNEAIDTAGNILRSDDFYSNANRRIFEAIINLSTKGHRADLITVTEELRQSGTLEQSGGPAYIASLPNVVPTSANIEYYAKLVQEASTRRALLRISDKMTASAFNDTNTAGQMVEDAQKEIFDLSDNRQSTSFKSVKEIIPKTIEIIEKLYNTKNPFTGVPSGLSDLDSMTCGFQKSELIIIGARPSVGKTALALSMAAHTAIKEKIPTAFFTLEMPDTALMLRLISSEAHINSGNLRTGLLKPSDFQGLLEAAGRIYEAPLYIVDMPNMRLMDLRAQARRLRAQQHVEIIFIDYLTLISSDNTLIPRHEQVAEISRSLKSLARELDIPIVALSQVRRDAEGKIPTLADIRESGSIEQDADVIMFLHREREGEKRQNGEQSNGIPTQLILAKQRNGPVGTVDIVFLPSYTKFVDLSKTG